MREKIIFLVFGLFVSLMTLYIHEARESIEPVVVTSQPLYRIYQIETEMPEAAPEQPEEFTPADVELDAELQEWIYNYCMERKISPALVMAVIEKESQCDINAMGDAGEAIGLMQIQVRWHKERMQALEATELTDSRRNITVGVDYLLELWTYVNTLDKKS